MPTSTPKPQTVDLDLGISEQELNKKPEISEVTMTKARKIIAFDKQEYAALERIREKKRLAEQKREIGIERAFKALVAAAPERQGILATELIVITDSTDLSSTMLRLRNYTKKRGDLWQIIKRQRNKQTVYYMEPTKAEGEP